MSTYVFKKRWKRLLVGVIDFFGGIIFLPVKFFPVRSARKKILVVRLDQIGDVIQAIPFIAALGKQYPDAEIHALCVQGTSFLLQHDPNISKVHTLPTSWLYAGNAVSMTDLRRMIFALRREHFDLAFDLRGDLWIIILLFLSGIKERFGYRCTGGGFLLTGEAAYDREEHEIDKNLKFLNEKSPLEITMNFFVTETAKKSADHMMAGITDVITMHPFSRDPSRMWGINKFNELAIKILDHNPDTSILIIGAGEDEETGTQFTHHPRLVKLMGKTSIYTTIELIKRSRLFIGNNSGMQYFAAYSRIRTCVIYGASTPHHRWIPKVKKDDFLFFTKDIPCGRCELKECPPERGHQCMEQITVDDVFESLQPLL